MLFEIDSSYYLISLPGLEDYLVPVNAEFVEVVLSLALLKRNFARLSSYV